MAIEGAGAEFQFGGSDFNAAMDSGWTTVGALVDVKPPDKKVGNIDTTNHDTVEHTKTGIGGWIESGEAEISCHYDPDGYSALDDVVRMTQKFRIRFSDGSGIGWTGYVSELSAEPDLEGLIMTKAKSKASGPVIPIASIEDESSSGA